MVAYVLVIVIYIVMFALAPHLVILHCEFSDDYFPLIKIKKFAFLFTGVSWQSAKTHGVVKECLITQVIGYILSFISAIVAALWNIFSPPMYRNYLIVYLTIITFVESIVLMVVDRILIKKEDVLKKADSSYQDLLDLCFEEISVKVRDRKRSIRPTRVSIKVYSPNKKSLPEKSSGKAKKKKHVEEKQKEISEGETI